MSRAAVGTKAPRPNDVGTVLQRRVGPRTPGRPNGLSGSRPATSHAAVSPHARRPRPLHARRGPTGWTPSPWLTDQHPLRGSSESPPGTDPSSSGDRWCRRPVLSTAVRAVVLAVSLVATTASAILVSRVLPRPATPMASVAWWLAVLVASTVALLAVHRVARRLLPLAQLLNLALAFPDKAPDRLRVAFRAGSLRHLEQRLARAREHGVDDEPTRAAATILALVGAITAHDRRTRGHSERVRAFNDILAEELRLPAPDREKLRWAALLHDVGKLHTPPSILNKPGPLDHEEWMVLHRHPEDGARITASLRDWLGPWATAIEQHHERWDGSGYPKGLAGTEISLGARIVAVADAYEVMTSPRPYHRAKSSRAAREEFACCASGSQFDPMVVRAFLTASLGRLRRVVGPVAWLAQLPLLIAGPKVATALAAAGRQVVATASAATALGVLTASGAIHAPPPVSPPPARTPVAQPPQVGARRETVPVAPPTSVAPTPSIPAPVPGAPPAAAPATQAPAARNASPAQRRLVTIDLAQLGVGGGVPPIEVSVPELPPLQVPPVNMPPVNIPPINIPPINLPPINIPLTPPR